MSFRFVDTARRMAKFWYDSEIVAGTFIGCGAVAGAYSVVMDYSPNDCTAPQILAQSVFGAGAGAAMGACIWATFPVSAPVTTIYLTHRAIQSTRAKTQKTQELC
jgi:hypothetical protein